ncbi:MAG: hypothetical protein VR64_18235 [Desulfatitalea sp. BRH_c12]|nr:MAG: hypothetical protein VR64_18235 [Desulfatitalea sp. BRH_c12]
MQRKTIYITENDKARLDWLMLFSDLFKERDRKTMRKLNYEISQGCVVRAEQIPPDVVTTHSRVVLQEIGGDAEFTTTLVFPEEADDSENRVSILTAIGTALIGCKTGDIIECGAAGGVRRLMVKKTSYAHSAVPQEQDNAHGA